MNDFRAEPEALVAAELAACERVIRSGWWILGEEVRSFEKDWSAWTQARHTIGCGNGLDAIEIALRALEVGPGCEVITTPMTAFATVLAILRSGAEPVLADIDRATAMLDPQSVRRCITPRTKALILVHLYGQIGPVIELQQIAAEHGLVLIEDCAQAHGARLGGKSAGAFGVCGAWSFYPTKNLGAVGDAGALTTDSEQLAEHARRLRNYGQTVRYHHPHLGMNSRLDELHAAMLRARLAYVGAWTQRRREIAHRYASGIDNPQVRALPLPAEPDRHVHHLFVVTAERRADLQAHLQARGIECLIHYPVPIHLQEPCRKLPRDEQGLRNAEAHADSCLSLPCHPALEREDVERVIAAVNEFPAH
jgi:dTDP-4-amino-4,6-dideoxygalactose transaminase